MDPLILLCLALMPVIISVSPVQVHAAESAGNLELPDQTVRMHLKGYLDRLDRLDASSSSARLEIDGQLQRFYKALDYRAAWTNRRAIERLVEVIGESADDGLKPSDYHYDEIRGFVENTPESPALKARADLLMTDAIFTLLSHMRSGKVMPRSLDPNWNIPAPKPGLNHDQTLMMAVMGGKFPEMISSLRRSSPGYLPMRKALARYRKIAEDGGWQAVYQGPTIEKVGQVDRRMPIIRQRLIVSGDLSPDAPLPKIDALPADSSASGAAPAPLIPPDQVYTQDLFDAVMAFQKRHGLSVDGIIGIETLNAMNYPAELRADQIRVNLERERWHSGIFGRTYVMVNIPAFTVEYVQDNVVRWNSRVIVGKPETQTPVFSAQIQSVIYNPQWVIPSGILAKEAIPAIRKDVGYLSKHRLTVVDSKGKPVDPSRVNWYGKGGFPYRLVQASGDDGSLGRIKFNMPNRFTVYMHDTPTKPLFERARRAYSHGCVRVDRPFELAELLLRNQETWSLPKIQAAINTGRTRTVPVPVKVPVFFLYQTVFADGGKVSFRDDIYDRDKELLGALNSSKDRRSVEEAAR
ncbi:peptidoglycan-binding protein [Chlorobaculum limnaeum]|uniref:Peptidoglycan-binding protein n=1 Tax=Chlorobaculum limnaeum TaxID=274537 RepID=A0A1D8D217_CHLLM|nr:L,D-transpeptidase family protein [Chlorobaculum limnaeum]AOS84461.1 peptidoglycan-binding protein [Chlorobaculum limnaeum]